MFFVFNSLLYNVNKQEIIMKNISHEYTIIWTAALIMILCSCTRDDYIPAENALLKKVKQDGYIVEEISYNKSGFVSEVNGVHFWKKFYYNELKQLIKEEVSMNPNSLSSSRPVNPEDGFVDPEKAGISMYSEYEYNIEGLLIKQINYAPKDGPDEIRSIVTYEYNDQNLASRMLMHNNKAVVTQFRTYQYDSKGNVMEEDYYTYLFIPEGAGPRHINRTMFEYDTYSNPYRIFEQSGSPGIFRNPNNITKTTTIHFGTEPGIPPVYTSTRSYEYDETTGYPVRVIDGEEFIYE